MDAGIKPAKRAKTEHGNGVGDFTLLYPYLRSVFDRAFVSNMVGRKKLQLNRF